MSTKRFTAERPLATKRLLNEGIYRLVQVPDPSREVSAWAAIILVSLGATAGMVVRTHKFLAPDRMVLNPMTSSEDMRAEVNDWAQLTGLSSSAVANKYMNFYLSVPPTKTNLEPVDTVALLAEAGMSDFCSELSATDDKLLATKIVANGAEDAAPALKDLSDTELRSFVDAICRDSR